MMNGTVGINAARHLFGIAMRSRRRVVLCLFFLVFSHGRSLATTGITNTVLSVCVTPKWTYRSVFEYLATRAGMVLEFTPAEWGRLEDGRFLSCNFYGKFVDVDARYALRWATYFAGLKPTEFSDRIRFTPYPTVNASTSVSDRLADIESALGNWRPPGPSLLTNKIEQLKAPAMPVWQFIQMFVHMAGVEAYVISPGVLRSDIRVSASMRDVSVEDVVNNILRKHGVACGQEGRFLYFVEAGAEPELGIGIAASPFTNSTSSVTNKQSSPPSSAVIQVPQ